MGNTPADSFKFIDVTGLPGANGSPAGNGEERFTSFSDGWERGAGTGGDRPTMDLSDLLVLREQLLATRQARRPVPDGGIQTKTADGAAYDAGFGGNSVGGDELVTDMLFGRTGGGFRAAAADADDYVPGVDGFLFDEDKSQGLVGTGSIVRSTVRRHTKTTLGRTEDRDSEQVDEDDESESFNDGSVPTVAGLGDGLPGMPNLATAIGRALGLIEDDESLPSEFPGYDNATARFPLGGFVREYGLNSRSSGEGDRTGELGLGEPEGMVYPNGGPAGDANATVGCTQPLAVRLGQLARLLERAKGVALVNPAVSIGSDGSGTLHYGPGAGDGDPKDVIGSLGGSETHSDISGERGYDTVFVQTEDGGHWEPHNFNSMGMSSSSRTVSYEVAGTKGATDSASPVSSSWTAYEGLVPQALSALVASATVASTHSTRDYEYLHSYRREHYDGDVTGDRLAWSQTSDVQGGSTQTGQEDVREGSAAWTGTDRAFTVAFVRGDGSRSVESTGPSALCRIEVETTSSSGGERGQEDLDQGLAHNTASGSSSESRFSSCESGSGNYSFDEWSESYNYNDWTDPSIPEPYEESGTWEAGVFVDLDQSDGPRDTWASGAWPSDEGKAPEADSGAGFDEPEGAWPAERLVDARGAWKGRMKSSGKVLVAYSVEWLIQYSESQTATGYVASTVFVSESTEFRESGNGIIVKSYDWEWDSTNHCGSFTHPALDASFMQNLVRDAGGKAELMWEPAEAHLPSGPGEFDDNFGYELPETWNDLGRFPEYDTNEFSTRGSDCKGFASYRTEATVKPIGLVVLGKLNDCPF